MQTFSIRPSITLTHDVDHDERTNAIPHDYMIRGAFCARAAERVGADWQKILGELRAPPRGNRYVAFLEYPQHDYARLLIAAARRLYPRSKAPEQMRRLARDDFATFAATTPGKVIMAIASDPASFLTRLPDAIRATSKGGDVRAVRESDRAVKIEFRDYHGGVDGYSFGLVEGALDHYGVVGTIDATIRSSVDATYQVRW